jgi:acetate kinase
MTNQSSAKPNHTSILTINGGSSSIKFALYHVGEPLKRGLYGKVDRIGLSGTNLTFSDSTGNQKDSLILKSSDTKPAANFLIDWLEKQDSFLFCQGMGHRVVHRYETYTGPSLSQMNYWKNFISSLLTIRIIYPHEIEFIEAFRQRSIQNFPISMF